MRNKRAKIIRRIAAAKAAEARKNKIRFNFRNYYRKLKKVWTGLSVNQRKISV